VDIRSALIRVDRDTLLRLRELAEGMPVATWLRGHTKKLMPEFDRKREAECIDYLIQCIDNFGGAIPENWDQLKALMERAIDAERKRTRHGSRQ